MHRITALLVVSVATFVGACGSSGPAEVRDAATAFPIVAHWTATPTPISPATVNGQLKFDQHLGYHADAAFTVTGPPNGVFQWRIFKGACSVNVAATGATAFTGVTGLTLFATTQSYPDITLDATGRSAVTSTIAGWLDSLTPYSVRIRPTATTTFNGVNPAACGDLVYAPAK